MNRYGQMALEHWRMYLPGRLAGIEDPDSFFSDLGLQVEQAVEELAERLAGPDRPGETYLDKLGRLRNARMTAESDVVRQMVLIDPGLEEQPAPVWPAAVTEWMALDAPLSPDEQLIEDEHAAERRRQRQ